MEYMSVLNVLNNSSSHVDPHHHSLHTIDSLPSLQPNRHSVSPVTLESLTLKPGMNTTQHHKLCTLIPVHVIVVPSLPPAPAPPPPGHKAAVEEVF